ncbi:MAG: IS200/IS605 family transposase [Prolixibacteraceae bacterium]|nr:IS200/IS605 family transposase [Prolixibacteraceae bacterium]
MPQSLAKVNVHIVFTTKYVQELITDEIRGELHSYTIGVLANLGSYTYELYANPDHIHILCTLPRTITMAELVSKIKTTTSKWLKSKGMPEFYWQDGYGIFSVSSSKIEVVTKYILNQPQHHKQVECKDEFRLFLKENGIEYDERYIWD